ncbi:hypothetical protein VTN00DRAFT_6548 [Thermoascus crustaceus]|uniref:uncharacterized protein n=1 Tax=Thermoascus crustaceus TaxID=5088 RepID=UPI0037423508
MSTTEVEYSVDKPLNREPPVKRLVASFITPDDAYYDRNHGPIPHLSADKHTVTVNGLVSQPLTLSIAQLRSDFPQHEVVCALQCAGNRRHTMRTLLKEVQGIDWMDAAVMNCKWRGPRLRDVLEKAGVQKNREGLHVAFGCYQVKCQDDDWFGGSVKLERGLREDGEVILALEMNDKPLPHAHGHPVRVVIPGVTGARWVKWLDRITVQENESPNYYQRRDYKILPPDATDSQSAQKYWDKVPPIMEMPINSVVAVPDDNETITLPPSGKVEVNGYAVPQGDQGPVTRVEVSGDGGKTWVDAQLEGSAKDKKWCWVLWRADVPVEKGSGREILSRATDAGGNTQQEHSEWNLRGVVYNGYGASRGLAVV